MSCTILLAIHPNHVKKILSGEKQYEFRKIKATNVVKNIVFYPTAPVCKIVASAEVETTLVDTIVSIWSQTKTKAGISFEFYTNYFINKTMAVAYKLKNVNEFKKPFKLDTLQIKAAPQSFIYLKQQQCELLDVV